MANWSPPSRSQSLHNRSAHRNESDQTVEMLHIRLPPQGMDLNESDVKLPEMNYEEGFANDYRSTDEKFQPTPNTISSFRALPDLLNQEPMRPPYKPTIGVLFSLSSRKELLTLTLPGVLISAASALIQPYLTTVLGKAFDSFSTFVNARDRAGADQVLVNTAKATFKKEQLVIFITLIIIAVVTIISSAVGLMFWNMNAEFIVRKLRTKVYMEVVKKKLEWFDKGMGLAKEDPIAGEEATEGSSAGLAGRFARDCDEVRMGTGQTFGLTLQALLTGILCLILGLVRNYQLTLIIFVTFPILIIASAVIEKLAHPLVEIDRMHTATASTLVERAVSAISTVKAFNAESTEASSFLSVAVKMKANYDKLTMLWGLRLGVAEFFLLMSFVQGFWYGNHLVQQGKMTPGQVTEVFWAIMIASSSFQQIIPFLNIIEQGKFAMAGQLNLIQEQLTDDPRPDSNEESAAAAAAQSPAISPVVNTFASGSGPMSRANKRKKTTKFRALRKIQPSAIKGELALQHVSFWYPTRPYPAPPTLNNVTMFLPAKEMTFVVGQSGSGKSTIGSLLLGLYSAQEGLVEIDEQGVQWLDEKWLRRQIGMVSQSSVIFEGTVHENVAIGALDCQAAAVSREKVIEACRVALVHDFIRDLPDGYDTILSGDKGASLSGGQKQRLAIARAYVRNPPILILDEATSALDATSRLLVFEALKAWRKDQTTIVITHDLNPIAGTDFVYVLKDGQVVENGYRSVLEADEEGWFSRMATLQKAEAQKPKIRNELAQSPSFQVTPPSRPVSQFEIQRIPSNSAEPSTTASTLSNSVSRYMDFKRRSSAFFFQSPSDVQEYINNERFARTPLSEDGPSNLPRSASLPFLQSGRESRFSMTALEGAAEQVMTRRTKNVRRVDLLKEMPEKSEIAVEVDSQPQPHAPSYFKVLFRLLPAIPNKILLCTGFFFCVTTAVATPLFSILFSTMLTTLGTGQGQQDMLKTALLILAVAFVAGVSMWLKYSLLQRAAMGWVNVLRKKTYKRMLLQDKSFYDEPEHSGMRLSHINVKDVNDARNMVGMVTGQFLIVIVMISLGLIWALVVGWELTLVGFAVAPVMIVVLGWQTAVLGKAELRNKLLRENITAKFHQVVTDIKAIRSMSLEPVFDVKYMAALKEAHKGHRQTAMYTGTAYSVGQAMNVTVEGVMLYVAALFVASGRYSLGQMLQVFALIMFSVTFGAQTMSYVPALTNSVAAAHDLLKLYDLDENTLESQGKQKYPMKGNITFQKVDFAYPARNEVKVLRDISMSIKSGECVGIVGASGSGKSTIVSLLQRLYEPSSGEIRIDGRVLADTDVHFLRDSIALVSQHPTLFNTSVSENIAYGKVNQCSQHNIEDAARRANAHDFILSLPNGYETNLGENAGLVSGGQAQRIAIARAVLLQKPILILDECTSALDAENQQIVMNSIQHLKEGRTTVVVTHKLDMMKMCDRLLVVKDGKIVEEGNFSSLMEKPKGVFKDLASQGEWLM